MFDDIRSVTLNRILQRDGQMDRQTDNGRNLPQHILALLYYQLFLPCFT